MQGTVPPPVTPLLYSIVHKIYQPESSIKAMERDIILTMERELNELKEWLKVRAQLEISQMQ